MDIQRLLNFSFVIEGRLAGLSFPSLAGPDVLWMDFLHKQSVTCLVNLTEYAYQVGSGPLEVLHVPVPDFGAISLEGMDKVWDRYVGLEPGEAMGVHCLAGRGRTGMVLAAMVAREFQMPPLDAVFYIRRLRPGSIETGAQEEFVEDWVYSRAV